ncbi:hypothetical protein GCM10008106_07320 [Mongoliitalea lutea]|uniref:Uncharacterized protein n=1 Tax=Mongoliitalea lutea TaxID=849756 RepID=A0A8J3G4A3_9BACT|nr:hypothetical protein GCM10008106_07320 [Mongoliitalea lutea]
MLSACENEDTKDLNQGTLIISGISLEEYQSNASLNSRIESQSNWPHIYASEVVLMINSTTTNENYELRFNPNDLSTGSSLSLPYGDYSYELSSTGEDVETFLPISAKGTFRLNQPNLNLSLQATTTYGLITVNKSNVKNTPILVLGQSYEMTLIGDFYYSYVQEGKEPVLEVIENIFGNTIRRNLVILAYRHYNFIIKVSDGQGKVVDILVEDFELIEEELLVNIGGVPTSINLSPTTTLQAPLLESSGLAYFGGELWSHNDSGNTNEIFQFSRTNGAILKTVTISNATNVDWEDFAENETHLFIGDFGNNNGNRTDLTIYRVKKSDVLTNTSVTAEKISFKYEDQTVFSTAPNNNNFDCEAFFFANDSLYLFSKNWTDNQTRWYSLPSKPGDYVAKLKGSFNVQGLITAADINTRTGDIILLGYTNQGFATQSFVWLLSGYPDFDIFEGKRNRISIGSPLVLSQTEGVYLFEDNTGWISSERIVGGTIVLPPRLIPFNFRNLF